MGHLHICKWLDAVVVPAGPSLMSLVVSQESRGNKVKSGNALPFK